MFELGKLMYEQGVRGEQNADNKALSRFSAIDCIQCCGNKKYKTYQAAKAKWDRLIAEDSDFKDELLSLTVTFKVIHHTNGTSFEAPGMTLIGIKILLFILGGEVAMEFRRTVDMFFTRFIAGDESLVAEIRANAANNSIMHKTFREVLQLEPMQNASASNDEQEVVKRPLDTLLGKRTLETDNDFELVDKQLTLHERAFELQQKMMQYKYDDQQKAIELQKKKDLTELEVKKAQEEVQLALKKAQEEVQLALKERKKYADEWGKRGLREKDIELQERQLKLQIEMRDNGIQMPQQATAAKPQKQSPPVSNRPASAANMPPPPSKEKIAAASTAPTPTKEKAAAASAAPTPAKEKAAAASAAPTPPKDKARPVAKGKRKPSSCAKDKSAPDGEGGTNSIRSFFVTITPATVTSEK